MGDRAIPWGALALAALLTPLTGEARARRPTACPGGRFIVQGMPLTKGAVAGQPETVDVSPPRVSVGGACAPVRGHVKASKKGTRVSARWRSCIGIRGRVLLDAVISRDCRTLAGTWKPGRAKRRRFRATTTCGDGVVDPRAAEHCESDAGCGPGERCVGCACIPAAGGGPLTALTGALTDPANAHIPDLVLPPATADEFSAPAGIPISRRTLGVFFHDATTVGAANAIIASLDATIVGGEPLIHLLVLALPESGDLAQMVAALAALAARPEVAVAIPNVAGESRMLPAHHNDEAIHDWIWDREMPPRGSNHGLEQIRAPQAWNLLTYALRARLLDGRRADVGVIDEGFDVGHPDLLPRLPFLGVRLSEHGTHVAGIMAAGWGNGLGVEGVCPHDPTIVARTYNRGGSYLAATHLQNLQTLYRDVLGPNPGVVAVNESYGMKTYAAGVVPLISPIAPPNPMTYAQFVDAMGDAFYLTSEIFALGVRSNFLVLAAVGYDARPGFVRVQDDSPMDNAAVRFPQGHYVAVEAVDATDAYNPAIKAFNRGGTVSAPGYAIRTTEATDSIDYDLIANGVADRDLGYATLSGTSIAAPHVTGLAAYLWYLDPGLTFTQVRTLLTDPAFTVPTVGGTRPRIDAFAAVMGIDGVRGNDVLQRALVDVDDGTPDGNQRTVRDINGLPVGDFTVVITPDGRRGDHRVSMQDFRALRDALVQALVEAGSLQPGDVLLDGMAANHVKKDLNFDGCIDQQPTATPHPAGTVPVPASCTGSPAENVFPRYDFNGDGRASLDRVGGTSGFLPFKGHDWNDVEVLGAVWPPEPDLNEGWTAGDLANLAPGIGGGGSGDLEVRTDLSLAATSDVDEIRLTIDDLPMERSLRTDRKRLVWTVPIGRALTVHAEGRKAGQHVRALCFNQTMPLAAFVHAQDRVLVVTSCAAGTITFDARNTHFVAANNWDHPGSGHSGSETLEDYRPLDDFPAFVQCPGLQVGETCTYALHLPGQYLTVDVDVEVGRLEAGTWHVEMQATTDYRVPPLPAAEAPGCGSRNPVLGSVGCGAGSGGLMSLDMHAPIPTLGAGHAEVSCAGSGGCTEAGDVPGSCGTAFSLGLTNNLQLCSGSSTATGSWGLDGTPHPVDLPAGGASIGLTLRLKGDADQSEFPDDAFDRLWTSTQSAQVTATITLLP